MGGAGCSCATHRWDAACSAPAAVDHSDHSLGSQRGRPPVGKILEVGRVRHQGHLPPVSPRCVDVHLPGGPKEQGEHDPGPIGRPTRGEGKREATASLKRDRSQVGAIRPDREQGPLRTREQDPAPSGDQCASPLSCELARP